MTSKKKRILRILLVVILAGPILWLGSSAVVAWKLTRRGRPPFPETPPEVSWGQIADIRLNTKDDEEIGAWIVRGTRPRGCVLLVHGVGGSRGDMLQVMRWLAKANFTVLAISLRSHGDSSGQTIDFGWSNRNDIIAAVEFLEHEYPQRPVYIVGHSMGAAAAIFAAGELKERVAGYFLAQPYQDLSKATWNRLHYQLPRYLDWVAYCGLRVFSPLFLPVAADQISPCERVKDIPEAVPIVFVTGSADRHAPLDEVEAVYHGVQSHAKLVVFDGAAHESLDRNDPKLYRDTLYALVGVKMRARNANTKRAD